MQHPYDALNPDTVIDAVETQGLLSDLRIYPLNSYENRVYQIGIEDGEPMVAKFYRPERWNRAQIIEEHEFCAELATLDISVVAPWQNSNGETLFEHAGFYFALYPRQGGHAPELGDLDQLLSIGRVLGRIHQLGKQKPFAHRPAIDLQSYGIDSREFLLSQGFIPGNLLPAYESLSQDLIERVQLRLQEAPAKAIRCHGDCHIGNILWRYDTPHFVDFDDAR
ncbi:MAG: serine/threonine protein kinase, partial [Cellvibrionaceae bacterium]|nr:serine/threonine protein kinase [Cellvibrionaceae bacterium]